MTHNVTQPTVEHIGPEPARATSSAGGYDVGVLKKTIIVENQCALVETGVYLNMMLSEVAMLGFLLPRSSLFRNHGLMLSNGCGLIDQDYQGQVMLSLWSPRGKATLEAGERIGQLVFLQHLCPTLRKVEVFSTPETARSAGGFGSTGSGLGQK